jgi:hypothetical protein
MKNVKNNSLQRIVEQEFPGLVQILESYMDFEKWGFKQSFYGVAQEFPPSIIYESNECRVRFIWLPADIRDGPDSAALNIKYGRLHASDQQKFMVWDGHNCHCWHNRDIVFNFLDGLSSQEAVEKRYKIPPIKAQFIQQNEGFTGSNIEWGARQESFIWKHYGNRLFDLFDLHRPDLWEQYMLFINECYRLDPGVFNPSAPPPENIC